MESGVSHVVILVLVGVDHFVGLLGHALRCFDAATLILRLGLAWSAEECATSVSLFSLFSTDIRRSHVEAKELHEPELCQTSLVAQECPYIWEPIEDPCDEGHGYHGRPRGVLDNRLGLARLNTLFEKVQGYTVSADSLSIIVWAPYLA
jgi:hypothetical protein